MMQQQYDRWAVEHAMHTLTLNSTPLHFPSTTTHTYAPHPMMNRQYECTYVASIIFHGSQSPV